VRLRRRNRAELDDSDRLRAARTTIGEQYAGRPLDGLRRRDRRLLGWGRAVWSVHC
jgi:hypothetical protein